MSGGDRALEILFRVMRGEEISIKKLAAERGVSAKSVYRDVARIRDFLAENRDLTGNAELAYCSAQKAYRLTSDEFLTGKELFAIAKALLGTRAFPKEKVEDLIAKFKRFTAPGDRGKLERIVGKELLHYSEIKHDASVIDNLWRLINVIYDKKEITILYRKVDRSLTQKRVQPVSLIFTEYYFYLIAYYPGKYKEPRYFRVDRIREITEHRQGFEPGGAPDFDEGLLRRRSQFMFYGPLRKIRFAFTGRSVQAILDRLPTARIVGGKRGEYIIEAETHGDGIKMFLLSQGAGVKVLDPPEFVEEMWAEISRMGGQYNE
jgi:predicted DNA-binding transcriptional regulator YafY